LSQKEAPGIFCNFKVSSNVSEVAVSQHEFGRNAGHIFVEITKAS